MITQKDNDTRLSHRYGGDGWAVVEWLTDGFCRVVAVGVKGIGNQIFTAWTKVLEPSKVNPVMPPKPAGEVQDIRSKLESGEWRVIGTRLVKV